VSSRCGFVALAGRPNVGKSTLANALVGAPVAAVSPRAQTTRRAIRGVRTRGETQLIVVDLPGLQRPRDLLGERMARRLAAELGEADHVLMVVDGAAGIGAGDRRLAATLKDLGAAATVAVNKVDLLSKAQVAEALLAAQGLGLDGEIFPISASRGSGVEQLAAHLEGLLPEGPLLFPAECRSDQPLELQVAELIREALLARLRDELPHASEVAIEEVVRRPDGHTYIRAAIWVEGDSQRAIVIGRGGRMVKEIGSAARRRLEGALGGPVYLELAVRTRRGWRSAPAQLSRLGIE